jgi:hypothetical protein
MMRAMMLAAAMAASVSAAAQDDDTKTLRSKLATLRLDVDFRNSSLRDVVDYLREVAGINIVIGAKVDFSGPLTMKARGVTVQSVLRLLLKPHQLGTRIQDGVLLIEREADLQSGTKLEIIDVRDLLFPIQDFPGVEITLVDTGGVVFAPAAADTPAEFPLVELIKAHVGGKTWDENPRASIQVLNGLLFVRQTDEIVQQIRKVLAGLRQYK